MLGAIAGDIIGSPFELRPIKSTDFRLFTDESHYTQHTILMLAVAQAIVDDMSYTTVIRNMARQFPEAGYEDAFYDWVFLEETRPCKGTGASPAVRANPVGWAFSTVDEVLREAQRTVEATHDHPETVKAAQAVALSVFLARTGASREDIRREISRRFNYNLSFRLAEIRETYEYDNTCLGTVPQAITVFLEANSVEDAIRKAVSLGGDSATLASIAGGIAEAYFKSAGNNLIRETRARLGENFIDMLDAFNEHFDIVDEDRGIASIW
jgi:ADP-ribosylglycohydrolase